MHVAISARRITLLNKDLHVAQYVRYKLHYDMNIIIEQAGNQIAASNNSRKRQVQVQGCSARPIHYTLQYQFKLQLSTLQQFKGKHYCYIRSQQIYNVKTSIKCAYLINLYNVTVSKYVLYKITQKTLLSLLRVKSLDLQEFSLASHL